MKTKEETIQLNKDQKDFYNNQGEDAKLNFFTSAWQNFRNGPLNSYQKKYSIRRRMYDLHKEWMGDLSEKKVLDLGCFSGNALSMYLAENSKEYVGIDLSDKATAELQEKIDKRNCPNARAVAVDFLSDDFKDGDFDVVYAFGVLHHFENFDLLMQRLQEKLKIGGEIISFDPLKTSKPVMLMRTMYRPFQQDKNWEWPFSAETFAHIQRYFTVDELRGILGKSKYGLLLHVMPFSEQMKNDRINKLISFDWRVQTPEDVLNCMQVTMRLRRNE